MTRFFLGFVEAAFFPGALFLLSKWYKRSELGTRIALLYCGNIISNAFGALMASGILDGMEGKLGQAAWRWLFFIEGSLTVFVALCDIASVIVAVTEHFIIFFRRCDVSTKESNGAGVEFDANFSGISDFTRGGID